MAFSLGFQTFFAQRGKKGGKATNMSMGNLYKMGKNRLKREGGNVVNAQYCTNHSGGNCSLAKGAKRFI